MNLEKREVLILTIGILIGAFALWLGQNMDSRLTRSQTVDNAPIYLPLVSFGQVAGCEGIPNNLTLHYILDNRQENYTVLDCLGLFENWEKTLQRKELVLAGGRWGIAQQGDPWLQVLIWNKTDNPYILNLIEEN